MTTRRTSRSCSRATAGTRGSWRPGSCPGCTERATAGSTSCSAIPRRRYLPVDDLVEVATYDVRTTTELEDLEHKQAGVYVLRPTEDQLFGQPAP